MAPITFTTTGSVRGTCGHAHRSVTTAAKCLRRDVNGCASQGGYSDRSVVRSDGEPLDNDDFSLVQTVVNGETR